MSLLELEVIIQNGEEAIQAEKVGADRLELVSAMTEGGLTPSYGTVKQVMRCTTLPVYVMIRPHSYGYFYNDVDQEIMLDDIQKVTKLGGTGIVIGALTKEGSVDEKFIQEVIEKFPDLTITFHRAFDEVNCQVEAYQTLAKYKKNIKYILTSGAAANCLAGKSQLRKLINRSVEIDGPKIMPGSGLSVENIQEIHSDVKANHYHFGKAVRVDQSFSNSFDPTALSKIREILNPA